VYAPRDYTLDGHYRPTAPDADTQLDHMYIDPFRSSAQVEQADLFRLLQDMGVPPSQHSAFLSETTTREMVLRTARNIMNSVQTIRQEHGALHGVHHSWIDVYPDMDSAFYATLWSMLILGPGPDHADPLSSLSTRRRQYLPYLLEHFQTHFPWDVTLIERYIVPMFQDEPEGRRLLHFVQSMHHMDALRKTPVFRSDRTSSVEFRIGQLFRHKRYQYEGVITGWDTSCDAGEDWIRSMDIDRLPNGRNQAFYHVLVCDKSVRYVASENISPVSSSTPPSPAMLKLAGRHFKRWDPETHRFVSNLKHEYPDD
jgi:F-box protein 21